MSEFDFCPECRVLLVKYEDLQTIKAEENYNVLRAEHQKMISELQILKLDFFSLKNEYDKLIAEVEDQNDNHPI